MLPEASSEALHPLGLALPGSRVDLLLALGRGLGRLPLLAALISREL